MPTFPFASHMCLSPTFCGIVFANLTPRLGPTTLATRTWPDEVFQTLLGRYCRGPRNQRLYGIFPVCGRESRPRPPYCRRTTPRGPSTPHLQRLLAASWHHQPLPWLRRATHLPTIGSTTAPAVPRSARNPSVFISGWNKSSTSSMARASPTA
jgi:hypothetical protein